MLRYPVNLARKIKKRGFFWLLSQLHDEWRYPHSKFGMRFQSIRKKCNPLFWQRVIRHRFHKETSSFIAIYDLAVKPVTYDFAVFLAIVEMHRKQSNYRDYVVVFVPGPKDGLRNEVDSYETVVPPAARKWRLANLVIPMLDLAPYCSGYHVCHSRAAAVKYLQYDKKDFFPADYDVTYPTAVSRNAWRVYLTPDNTPRLLRAPLQAKCYVEEWFNSRGWEKSKTISITIRHYGYEDARNSNVSSWCKLAEYLELRGYRVVFVPDLDDAMRENKEISFTIFDQACWNLHLRMALYELCYVNMFVNSGPAALCYLSDAPYIMTKIVTEDVGQTCQTSLEDQGYSNKCTPEFASHDQVWAWHEDGVDSLKTTFDQYEMERTRRGG